MNEQSVQVSWELFLILSKNFQGCPVYQLLRYTFFPMCLKQPVTQYDCSGTISAQGKRLKAYDPARTDGDDGGLQLQVYAHDPSHVDQDLQQFLAQYVPELDGDAQQTTLDIMSLSTDRVSCLRNDPSFLHDSNSNFRQHHLAVSLKNRR